MRVFIDASIFIGSANAYGRISGGLNLAAIPTQGAVISFLFPLTGKQVSPPHFSGQLRVASVIFQPSLEQESVPLIMLEDLVFDSATAAKATIEYLTGGFQLAVDEYQS